jgi:hypothetical protein
MKESELIEMKRKIESLARVSEFMLKELEAVKTLSVGTFQTIKEMPAYKKAIKNLTDKAAKDSEEQVA